MAEGDPIEAGNQNQITINAETLGEFKDDPVFKPFEGKDISEVFKSFKNAQSMVGGDKVVLPTGKLNTPENWNHVLDKLGAPKDINGYKFERPELPEGMAYDEKLEKAIAEACHYLRVLPWQAQGLNQVFNKYAIEKYNNAVREANSRAEELENNLIREFGTKEKYDEFVKGANAALKHFSKGISEEDLNRFIETYTTDPVAVRFFGNVANGMMEDAALRGDKSFNLLGEDASAKLKDILYNTANPLNKAYFDNSHPQHQYAVDEVYRLNVAIHGEKKVKE